MKALLVHNRYVHPGGEDAVVRDEVALLGSHGHAVLLDTVANGGSFIQRVCASLRGRWNAAQYSRVRALCERERPDVAHIHNCWYTLSPAVFAACHDAGVPTVLTLHNFRLLCVNALLMRAGRPCEDCVGRSPWLGVRRRCYHGSFVHSALVARMIGHNRRRRTWERDVDAFIALTDFCRQQFIAGGLPAERIAVKPNFLAADPGAADTPGIGAVFVGRLSAEKGVRTLVGAWRQVAGVPLTIVGDGPERPQLQALAGDLPQVRFTGQVAPAQVMATIKQAACLVLPSECYENCPRTILETYACGRPVVASRLGAMAELVRDGETGRLFEAGNAADLAATVKALLADPAECARLGRNARAEFEAKYTADRNYEQLMNVYGQAQARR